jgi:hypothetical protein
MLYNGEECGFRNNSRLLRQQVKGSLDFQTVFIIYVYFIARG